MAQMIVMWMQNVQTQLDHILALANRGILAQERLVKVSMYFCVCVCVMCVCVCVRVCVQGVQLYLAPLG